MLSVFNTFIKRKRKIPEIDILFNNLFFKNINYPIIINITIFIIYRDALSKFYSIDFTIIDTKTTVYNNQIIKDISTHINQRIYAENYSYIYHLENLNQHETINYPTINTMFQKVFTKVIHRKKDFKDYLELVLFGPAEPFIENIKDLD